MASDAQDTSMLNFLAEVYSFGRLFCYLFCCDSTLLPLRINFIFNNIDVIKFIQLIQ